ncbi:dephospho-CoA kinase [Pacificimonas flava]|uniref:Dephospho-CoA kinase n=2 Tax=Pacificimonas TaxID=1960290 RepID=A0A219B4E4_9SPHN|nr:MULTISPECIES: dephospho-CoA kinase [Pacificimonas]MBZ6377634.1 dephospho-CoA kinase [Pacificimonas aurantium]OWV32679.1 dephospho-CoA kinase [Pacificimonas flava]
MKLIGLTGSIGMGKSTIAGFFRAERVPVFDADAEVHRLQAPGGRALALIEEAFPGVVVDGRLDRAALGKAVFGDTEALRRLERIMHPLVGDAQARFLRRYRQARTPFAVLDIPLLYEKGGWERVDGVVVVSAPPHVQRARVMARPGMTREKFENIVARQVPDAEKRRRADFVIETGLGKRRSRLAVSSLTACLKRHSVEYCRKCERSSSIPKRRA